MHWQRDAGGVMRRKGSRPVIGGWYEAYAEQRTSPLIVGLSAAAHVLLVAAFIDASGPAPADVTELDFRPVFYLAPPNRPITDFGGSQRIEYVALGSGGAGSGSLGAPAPEGDPSRLAVADRGSAGDHAAAPESITPEDEEPVYTVVEVHEEAVRVASSAAPAYPPALLAEGIEGTVLVRYVVEANGAPDVSSFRVISATRREFADAVRAALPHMRFTPARIDHNPVRQLVEQPFTFRIQRPPPGDTIPDATGRARR
jgi:TonB family protein